MNVLNKTMYINPFDPSATHPYLVYLYTYISTCKNYIACLETKITYLYYISSWISPFLSPLILSFSSISFTFSISFWTSDYDFETKYKRKPVKIHVNKYNRKHHI